MKYHNSNTLCLTYDEFVGQIVPRGTYDSLKSRKKITVHGLGGNGREVLIEYESMPDEYRNKVREQYGNPYEYVAKQPLIDYVKINWDNKAEEFYRKYVLPATNSKLPDDYIPRYTKAATWLNAIGYFTTDKKALKQQLNICIAAFWEMTGSLIRMHDIALPINERALKRKLSAYKVKGYDSLVDAWRFGNDNSKKVKDDVAEALLMKMIAHPHKHDDTIIAAEYNKWAVKNDRLAITPQAVSYRRRQNEYLLTYSREGASISYNKFSKRILRDRPSAPLLLINSDDNILDLFFKHEVSNGKGKTVKNDFYRPAGYFIIDTYNDYILGYAIGKTVTVELIKEAYRNAIRHVMELTGGAHLWHQIQSDRWSIDPKLTTPLATFFKDQAIFTPATAKVSQSKYIERSFGDVWHQQLKFFKNYAGFNITAKEKMNPDAIQLARKDYPNREQAPEVVAEFVTRMRHTINPKTGLPRQIEWVNAFNEAQKSKERLITDEKRLQLFGITHPFTNRITAAGLRVQISNLQRYYEVPDELYLENVNKQVNIIYDPYDMGQVLVTNGKGLRFVAQEFERMPSALADYKEDTGKKLHAKLEFKKQTASLITRTMDEYAEILIREGIDAASVLQAGVKVKEISHEASHVLMGNAPTRQLPVHNEEYDWRNEL